MRIDLGIPAEEPDREPVGAEPARIRRGDPSGRYWALASQDALPHSSLLSLGASFSQGGVPYGVLAVTAVER